VNTQNEQEAQKKQKQAEQGSRNAGTIGEAADGYCPGTIWAVSHDLLKRSTL
jgi:hypothetical protein